MMSGPYLSVQSAIAATQVQSAATQIESSSPGRLVEFKPHSSGYKCSRALKSHAPFNPFKHHGNSYISLVAAAAIYHENPTTNMSVHTSKDSVSIIVGITKFTIDRDLVPDDCISGEPPNQKINWYTSIDDNNKVISLTVFKNNKEKHFTLNLTRNLGSDDIIIDLVDHGRELELNGSKVVRLVEFKPHSSGYKCSRALKSHTPFNPFKHHGNGYISLVAAAAIYRENPTTNMSVHTSKDSVSIIVGITKFTIDRDLVQDDCISGEPPNQKINWDTSIDDNNKVISLTVFKNNKEKHFTLNLTRNLGSDDIIIDLVDHGCELKLNGSKTFNYFGDAMYGIAHGEGTYTDSYLNKYKVRYLNGKLMHLSNSNVSTYEFTRIKPNSYTGPAWENSKERKKIPCARSL